MKNFFYAISTVGFAYSLYLILSRWGAFGYGFEYYVVYHGLGSIAFLVAWIVLAFRDKNSLSKALSVLSLLTFAVSIIAIIYAAAQFL